MARHPSLHPATGLEKRMVLDQHQRLFQQVDEVGLPKLEALIARVDEKIRNQLVEPLGFPADDADELRMVVIEVGELLEQLNGTGDGGQGIPNLMRNARGKAAERSHPVLGAILGLPTLLLRAVLKVANISDGADIGDFER